MLLSDAPNGASFTVVNVSLSKEVGKRLADMGFTEGAEGAVVRSGFFRGPLQVRIRGYDILIRRFEASGIEVDPVGDWSAAEDASRLFFRGRLRRGHGHHGGHHYHGGHGAPEGAGGGHE
jgi:ferrous iron transport protein A